jgi:hypothetical protein
MEYPFDCNYLFLTSLEYALTKFVPVCKGILRTIWDLVVDETYMEDPVALPIDALVIDLIKDE